MLFYRNQSHFSKAYSHLLYFCAGVRISALGILKNISLLSPPMEMPNGLQRMHLPERNFMRASVVFICIIEFSHLYFFSSSESYEGISQHLNIYFLSVLQFKYLRFYMYSKRLFGIRLPEVYFWNWHLFNFSDAFALSPLPPSKYTAWNINDDNVDRNTIEKQAQSIWGSRLIRKYCSFKSWNKPFIFSTWGNG